MTQAKDTVAADAIYYGCDGFDGLAGQFEDFSVIPQEVSMLSHFDSNATEGAASDFIKKYTDKFGTDTLNQFGASAYDCVYAMVGALKAAASKGTKVEVTMSPKEVYEVLKGEFQGGYSFSGVTGKNVTWDEGGTVNKTPGKFVVNPNRAK